MFWDVLNFKVGLNCVNMTEEAVSRKKIIERSLKKTKLSTTEIEKLLLAYETTVVRKF